MNDSLIESLNKNGTSTLGIALKLAEPQSAKVAIEKIEQTFGRIDAVVNHWEGSDGADLQGASPGKFRASIENSLLH